MSQHFDINKVHGYRNIWTALSFIDFLTP